MERTFRRTPISLFRWTPTYLIIWSELYDEPLFLQNTFYRMLLTFGGCFLYRQGKMPQEKSTYCESKAYVRRSHWEKNISKRSSGKLFFFLFFFFPLYSSFLFSFLKLFVWYLNSIENSWFWKQISSTHRIRTRVSLNGN